MARASRFSRGDTVGPYHNETQHATGATVTLFGRNRDRNRDGVLGAVRHRLRGTAAAAECRQKTAMAFREATFL
jgi:hypothetical protein